jgi:hypothetical protein
LAGSNFPEKNRSFIVITLYSMVTFLIVAPWELYSRGQENLSDTIVNFGFVTQLESKYG